MAPPWATRRGAGSPGARRALLRAAAPAGPAGPAMAGVAAGASSTGASCAAKSAGMSAVVTLRLGRVHATSGAHTPEWEPWCVTLCADRRLRRRGLTRSKASAPKARALRVARCGLAGSAGSAVRLSRCLLAGLAGTPAAIAVAAVAAAAQHDLNAATRAQVQAGGTSMRTPAQPKCWTDSSQRATLLRHHLHRHGVGRGTVVKLPGESDRCRAHLLRHRPRCTAACLTSVHNWPQIKGNEPPRFLRRLLRLRMEPS
jgi:hypothetical protein